MEGRRMIDETMNIYNRNDQEGSGQIMEGRRMIDEAMNILTIAKEKGIKLRLIGAIAFRVHCPKYGHFYKRMDRVLTDIDFMAYNKDLERIEDMLTELGYVEDLEIKNLYYGRRLIFQRPTDNLVVDVFFDILYMCHTIEFRGRLEFDYPTIPLVDMLLEKMQIAQLTEKDKIDTATLVREHDIGENNREKIDGKYLSKLCASNWGLWRTVSVNLQKVKSYVLKAEALSDTDKINISAKLEKLLEVMEREPKSIKWRFRAIIGEKKKWYRDVSPKS